MEEGWNHSIRPPRRRMYRPAFAGVLTDDGDLASLGSTATPLIKSCLIDYRYLIIGYLIFSILPTNI